MSTVTRDQLENASRDLQTIGEAANKNGDVESRNGDRFPSVQKSIQDLNDKFNRLFDSSVPGQVERNRQLTQEALEAAQQVLNATQQAGNSFPDVATGMAELSENDYFTVPTSELVVGYRLYRIVNGEAEQQPVNTALDLNSSNQIAQITGRGDVAVAGISKDGSLVLPGAPDGIQSSVVSKSLARVHAIEQFQSAYGRETTEHELTYWRLRAMHDVRPPRKDDFNVVPADEAGTKLQRIPATLRVSPGVLFVTNSQVHENGPNSDRSGLRMVGRYVYYDEATKRPTRIGDPIVIDQPDGWEDGQGVANGASLFLRDDGDIVAIYRHVAPDSDRDIVKRIISGSSVSDRFVIARAADTDKALLTENGSAVVLKNGPAAGRWVAPIYGYADPSGENNGDSNAVIYSDDQGVTWQFSDPISENNEWAMCLLPNGAIVGSGRKPGKDHVRLYCPPEGNGISGWQTTYLDYSQWFQHSNNRSIVCTSLDPADGIAAVLWCSTVPLSADNSANSGTGGRRGLGLRVSVDDLVNVSHEYRFSPPVRPAGYSNITPLGDGYFAVVYETGFNGPPVEIRATILNLAEVFQHGYEV